ncbi:MAG: hypothetical protein AAF235_06925, partial [Planctomycetota bacterium]
LLDLFLIIIQAVFFIGLGRSIGGDFFREVLVGLFALNIIWGGVATLMHSMGSYDVGASGPWRWSVLNTFAIFAIFFIEHTFSGGGIGGEVALLLAMSIRTLVDFRLMSWWYVDEPEGEGGERKPAIDGDEDIFGPARTGQES